MDQSLEKSLLIITGEGVYGPPKHLFLRLGRTLKHRTELNC